MIQIHDIHICWWRALKISFSFENQCCFKVCYSSSAALKTAYMATHHTTHQRLTHASACLKMCSPAGLTCIFIISQKTNGGREGEEQRISVSHKASSCVCRDETVVSNLNQTSAYWLLPSIYNSSQTKSESLLASVKSWTVVSPSFSHCFLLINIHTAATDIWNLLSWVWPGAVSLIWLLKGVLFPSGLKFHD